MGARNILLDGNDNAKIADFGLGKYVDGNYYVGSSKQMFPLRWLAPEIIKFQKFSTASDVWAFGCTLYEISMNGTLPFAALSNEGVRQMLLGTGICPLEKPSNANDKIFEIMVECLQFSISLRPTFNSISKMLENEFKEQDETK